MLNYTERNKVFVTIFVQIFLTILDLFGVLAIAFITYLLANGRIPSLKFAKQFEFLGLDTIIYLLVVIVIFLFTLKSILAPFLYSKTMGYLGLASVRISLELSEKFFSKPHSFIQKKKSQDSIYSLNQGVTAAVSEIIGPAIILLSEFVLLFLLLLAMFISNWILSLLNVVLFTGSLFFINKIIGEAQFKNTNIRIKSVIVGNSLLIDIINAFREIVVLHKIQFFLNEFEAIKRNESTSAAKNQVLNITPKYIFEVIFYLSAGVILLFLNKFSSPEDAFSLFALFVASGARILPSILRIQGSLAQIKSSEALSNQTFLLIEEMNEFNSILSPHQINNLEIGCLLKIKALKFSYPEKPGWNLHIDELSVGINRKIAIVGPSGSGKSTLVDLILGILTPSEGTIEFLGRSDAGVPVAFIPQRISVLNRSVRENVAFGVTPVDISDAKVWDCITIAGLTDLIAGYPNGINEILKENGSDLSGGQRQRIGFARAMYINPQVIILDESTSSLDSESEFKLAEALKSLGEKISIITIAHRLSTIRDYDVILYMEAGKVKHIGTFDELKEKSKSFNLQAAIMGL